MSAPTPPRFRIYYGSDSDYATYSGDPYFAPTMDIQVVVQDNRTGPMSNKGKAAFYWKPDSGWHSCDQLGLWDYLCWYKGPKAILICREMESDKDYYALVKRAEAEGLG